MRFHYCKITNPQPQFAIGHLLQILLTQYMLMWLFLHLKKNARDPLSYAPPDIITPSSHSLSSNLLDISSIAISHNNSDNSSEISDAGAIYPGRTIKCHNAVKLKSVEFHLRQRINDYMIKSTNIIYTCALVYSYLLTYMFLCFNVLWFSQRGHISFM